MTLERPPVDIITRRAKPGTVREGWVFTADHEWLKLSHSQPYVGADQRPRPEPIVIEPERQRGQSECRPAAVQRRGYWTRNKKIVAAVALILAFGAGQDPAQASDTPGVPTVVTAGL